MATADNATPHKLLQRTAMTASPEGERRGTSFASAEEEGTNEKTVVGGGGGGRGRGGEETKNLLRATSETSTPAKPRPSALAVGSEDGKALFRRMEGSASPEDAGRAERARLRKNLNEVLAMQDEVEGLQMVVEEQRKETHRIAGLNRSANASSALLAGKAGGRTQAGGDAGWVLTPGQLLVVAVVGFVVFSLLWKWISGILFPERVIPPTFRPI